MLDVSEDAEDVEDPENGPLLFSFLVNALDDSVDWTGGVSVCVVDVKSTDMAVFDSESLANETRLEPDRLDFGDVDTLAGKLLVFSVFFSVSSELD